MPEAEGSRSNVTMMLPDDSAKLIVRSVSTPSESSESLMSWTSSVWLSGVGSSVLKSPGKANETMKGHSRPAATGTEQTTVVVEKADVLPVDEPLVEVPAVDSDVTADAAVVVAISVLVDGGVGASVVEGVDDVAVVSVDSGRLVEDAAAVLGAVVMAVNLLVDVTYGIINPRIRHPS